jgi:hypothetical protein
MRFAKIAFTALGLALAAVMVVPAAHAGVGNQMTRLTFSRPVQIPDHKVLPAGTYWFQTLNNQALPNSVLIYNKNRTRAEAILLTTPTYRARPRGRTEVTLAGGSKSRPPILLKWFYPGTDWGHEFMYSSKTEARIGEQVARNILVKPYSSVG